MDRKELNNEETPEPSTPLMKQYFAIKEAHKDAILFFRLGDFYEMFGEDARTASRLLQITLTTRDKGSENPIPMCGVPHFAADNYITRLVNEGYKVAICEQVEDAENTKGIVRREVARVISPGTHEPENPKESSYMLALYPLNDTFGIALAELSTGEFTIYETSGSLEDELSLTEPREILCPESLRENIFFSESLKGRYVTYYDDWAYDFQEGYKRLLSFFKVASLEGFGCEGFTAGISAGGALLEYLIETQKSPLGFSRIATLDKLSFMELDSSTKRNLELLANLKDGSQSESLLQVLDETLTPMGGRFLRNSIVKPLRNADEIRARLNAVEALVNDFELIENIRYLLRSVYDIERLSVRLSMGRVNARDLVSIKNSVALLPKLKKLVSPVKDDLLQSISDEIEDFTELKEKIEKAVADSPPFGIKEGGIIRKGYSKEVDELRELSENSREYLARFESEERQNTGINSLKVGYNKIYGYFIEVTKTNLNLVPPHYVRKQTLVNAERFVTDKLKEFESKILSAEEKLKTIEFHLFQAVVSGLAGYSEQLKKASSALALFDFLLSLALVARRHNYVKPSIGTDGKIEITEGRHPVLERLANEDRFVPNNSVIDTEGDFLLIITGPNMAGKSTYMRQTALIVLMSQLGSFVPAESAHLGIVDRIFTRIGASDYLTKGQSTFMVEMIETANILNNATEKSLILLDEVGRGTSTFDGISIAWAIAEHIATSIKSRTLFATHYNELTEMAATADGVKNLNIAVREWGDEIIFLRKIENGAADKSYGIQVARLAGLPQNVLQRAKEILNSLEQKDEAGKSGFGGRKGRRKTEQLDLFGIKANPVLTELDTVDADTLTPEGALSLVLKLKSLSGNQ